MSENGARTIEPGARVRVARGKGVYNGAAVPLGTVGVVRSVRPAAHAEWGDIAEFVGDDGAVHHMYARNLDVIDDGSAVDYESMGVPDLRKLVRDAGIARGSAVADASKATLLEALQTGSWPEQGAAPAAPKRSGAPTDNDPADVLARAIEAIARGAAPAPTAAHVDEAGVRAIVHDALDAAIEERRIVVPMSLDIDPGEGAPLIPLGIVHERFPVLLRACRAARAMPVSGRFGLYLLGPAGTGKTHAAHAVADALGLPFHFQGRALEEWKLLGFRDATGTYHRTPFRDAYEHGGVFLWDELDSSHPNAVLAFNTALANGSADFPDGKVPKHADFIMIGAGNRPLTAGADPRYTGRMRQDASVADRFVTVDWPIDDALEDALAGNAEWVARVRTVRAKAEKSGHLGLHIGPRASIFGAALLKAGFSRADVETMVLRQGMDSATWRGLQ